MVAMLLPDQTYEEASAELAVLFSFLARHRIRPEFFCRYRQHLRVCQQRNLVSGVKENKPEEEKEEEEKIGSRRNRKRKRRRRMSERGGNRERERERERGEGEGKEEENPESERNNREGEELKKEVVTAVFSSKHIS
ncbi:hypothetical protein LSTR_LSTR000976 [Laodelphax striatellus]|uniref:Uncharacterized protein n=1 Tax=Laodelphax striatellus TaxID=195883 RepID=A0A482X0U4_LAOST|nr:hypothetical protein LSTR_LSTR000976 [Laodelphax striatellus]